MVYKLLNLKNEFGRYIKESKSYGVDYFSGKIADMIYLCGLIMTLSFTYGSLNFNILLKLLMWYILYNASLNAVSDGEFEIRADFFKNLTYTRTSIWQVYLNRFIVYTVEAIVVFALSLLLMQVFVDVDFSDKILFPNVLIYLITSLVLNLLIYYFLMSLTFIFERIMTFASLLMTFLLFITGMVFNFNNIFSKSLLSNIASFLDGPITIFPLIVVTIGSFLVFGFTRYTENYIRKY